MSDLILSIDVGTSMVKAGCYTAESELVAMASVRSAPATREGVDAELVWERVCMAIGEVLGAPAVAGHSVMAVVVTGQGDGLWTIGSDGAPAGPAYQWNDARAQAIVAEWERSGSITEAYRLNDTVMWPGTSAALWRWLGSNLPEQVAATRWVVCASDWVNYRLTGVVATDVSNAGIPFLDPDRRAWSEELMEVLGCEDIASRLPDVMAPGDRLGVVSTEASAATGLAAGTPVHIGSIDVVAMFRGLGMSEPGSVVAVLGTTAVALASIDGRPASDEPVGATCPMPEVGRSLRVLGATSGTSTLDWYVGSFLELDLAKESFSAVLDEVQSVDPADATAMLLPFLAGERAPFLAPEASGTFIGITHRTSRAHMSYGVVEGITMSLRHCVESAVPCPERVVLTGGGATSTRWRQMTADVLGTEIVPDSGDDRACLGAVSFVTGSIPAPLVDAEIVHPRRSPAIDERFERYKELTGLLRPAWRSLQGGPTT